MDPGQIDKLEAWRGIQATLEDPRRDFKTVEGISRETGLNAACIVELLEKHQSEVRRVVARRHKGRALYTTRPKSVDLREVNSDLQAFASKSF